MAQHSPDTPGDELPESEAGEGEEEKGEPHRQAGVPGLQQRSARRPYYVLGEEDNGALVGKFSSTLINLGANHK